jgi:hypothetical protein
MTLKVKDLSYFGHNHGASPEGSPTYQQILNGAKLKPKDSLLEKRNFLLNTLRLDYNEFKKSQISIREIQSNI